MRTLTQVSKTERALSSTDSADALDELFDDDSFDAAFGEALDDADHEFGIADARTGDVDQVADPEIDDTPETDDVVVIETDADETDADDVDVADQADAESDVAVDDHAVDEQVGQQVDGRTDDDGPTAELTAPRADPEADDEPTPVNEAVIAREQPAGDPDSDVDDDDVSDRILEELRRAEIDGPVVAFAPQDDTTAARRRPRQAADYDPAPVPIPAKVPRVLGRKARVRKVTRVVRSVDPWSVFKIALVANFVMYVIVLTASVLLWNVAYATGTVDNIERFFESFGWNSFEFNGGELYHAGWIAGLFVVIGLTGLAVLAATLFNLITDLVGGVRFTVLEEEVVETRTSPMRRFVVRRPEPEVPAVIRDASGAMYREAVVDDTGANERPTR